MKRLNTILHHVMMTTNIIILIAYTILGSIELVARKNCLIAGIISIIAIATIEIGYRVLPESNRYRYLILLTNTGIYYSFVFLSGLNGGYMVGMIASCMYIFFFDITLCCLLVAMTTSITIAFLINVCIKGYFPEGNPVTLMNILLALLGLIGYGVLFTFATWIAGKIYSLQINDINLSTENSKNIMNGMLSTAKIVKDRVKLGISNINDLNTSLENSNLIFDKISEGNASNASSVEVQTEMTIKITNLIDHVVEDSNNAKIATDESINVLNKSKEALHNLKEKSREIMYINNELLAAMNEFIESAKNVKHITSGITELSEQTTLLSFNATIESAKAGALGKGFGVISHEVRNLSTKTNKFTSDIEKIVKLLEKDSLEAQNLISEIKHSLHNENITINKTLNRFNNMELSMDRLNTSMSNILESTDDVVNYNNSIMDHIEQLSAETEEVSAYVEEVVFLNKFNKEQMDTTVLIMHDLNNIVNQSVIIN